MEWIFVVMSGIGILITGVCFAFDKRCNSSCPPSQEGTESMSSFLFAVVAGFSLFGAAAGLWQAFANSVANGLLALSAAVVAGIVGCFLRRMITY